MYPAATAFLDVCVQADLWTRGAWPLVNDGQAASIVRLFAMAARFEVRQGGVICRHGEGGVSAVAATAVHCGESRSAYDRPPGCMPSRPIEITGDDSPELTATATDLRTHAIYVDSGCALRPDAGRGRAHAFDRLVAGVRDAVVFGAGVEYGIDRVVAALLDRRIRTHVALDAVGSADDSRAQMVVAQWKRWGVDGVTVEVLERLLVSGRS